jgi:hypothetical protein
LEEDEAKTRIVKEETKKNTKLERENERREREKLKWKFITS